MELALAALRTTLLPGVNDSRNLADYRNNCKQWHAWAECPEPNQLATGPIGYCEAGTEPRSLTGLQLLCQSLSQSYIGGWFGGHRGVPS